MLPVHTETTVAYSSYGRDTLTVFSIPLQRYGTHMYLNFLFSNPTLKLPFSINLNQYYLQRKHYTLINGLNNCAQYTIWLVATACVNSMIAVCASFIEKSCYYHCKKISIYLENSEDKKASVLYTRVILCSILHCSKTANHIVKQKHIYYYTVEKRMIPMLCFVSTVTFGEFIYFC